MRQRTTRTGSRGFTLLEVLVGVAVGGVVLLAGFAALAAVHDRGEHAVEATLPGVEGARVRSVLLEWLSGAQRTSQEAGVAFEVERGAELGLPSDALRFPTRARTPLESQVTGVHLHVNTDPAEGPLGLVAALTYREGDLPLVVSLAPEVTGLQVRCWPDDDLAPGWDDACTPGFQSLPRGVELTFEASDPERLPPLLRLPLRVALPGIR